MNKLFLRLSTLSLAALCVVAVAPSVSASSDLTVSQAEARVVQLLNQQRAAVGLLPLRVDSRLATIARSRSTDMAVNDYFSHSSPSGANADVLMNRAGVTWYAMGEIIAWNTRATIAESADRVAGQWRESAGHYGIIVNREYNYFALGLAVDGSGKKLWTGVFLKGPDRTGAYARFTSASGTTSSTPTLTWTGSDIKLQTLTAGFRDYQIAYSFNGGRWHSLVAATTATSKKLALVSGRRYEFSIRARDNNGNYGRSVRLSLTTQ